MKKRFELFSIFQSLLLVQTQFGKKIKILCCANKAREYLSATFSSFLSQQGILYHFDFHIHPNKMILLNERTYILLIWLFFTIVVNSLLGYAILIACYLL